VEPPTTPGTRPRAAIRKRACPGRPEHAHVVRATVVRRACAGDDATWPQLRRRSRPASRASWYEPRPRRTPPRRTASSPIQASRAAGPVPRKHRSLSDLARSSPACRVRDGESPCAVGDCLQQSQLNRGNVGILRTANGHEDNGDLRAQFALRGPVIVEPLPSLPGSPVVAARGIGYEELVRHRNRCRGHLRTRYSCVLDLWSSAWGPVVVVVLLPQERRPAEGQEKKKKKRKKKKKNKKKKKKKKPVERLAANPIGHPLSVCQYPPTNASRSSLQLHGQHAGPVHRHQPRCVRFRRPWSDPITSAATSNTAQQKQTLLVFGQLPQPERALGTRALRLPRGPMLFLCHGRPSGRSDRCGFQWQKDGQRNPCWRRERGYQGVYIEQTVLTPVAGPVKGPVRYLTAGLVRRLLSESARAFRRLQSGASPARRPE
jgi:hypothetical protein